MELYRIMYLFTEPKLSLKAQKKMINGSTEITVIRHSDITPVMQYLSVASGQQLLN